MSALTEFAEGSAPSWCHVMDRESFENPQTAKLLNEHFVNVKVDREERPDVDRFCMAFVQATMLGSLLVVLSTGSM